MTALQKIKIYYDNYFHDIEIVCPNGDVFWACTDDVAGKTCFVKARSNHITSQDPQGDNKRFTFIGEL